jgi:hypothetical protein
VPRGRFRRRNSRTRSGHVVDGLDDSLDRPLRPVPVRLAQLPIPSDTDERPVATVLATLDRLVALHLSNELFKVEPVDRPDG